MGLASSQARLLLLTSRKSDLEYKSQMISQRKIMLSMQTEGLGTEYTKALSNTRLMMSYYNATNENQSFKEQITYAGLTSGNGTALGKFLITDESGVIQLPPAEAGKAPELPTWIKEKLTGTPAVPANGTTPAVPAIPPSASINTTNKTITIDGVTYKYAENENLSNKMAFQDSLQNGSLYLKKYDPESQSENDAQTPFFTQAISGSTNFDSELYTEDDAKAQAEYEQASRKIQNQDKILDLELKNIETQHKAIETEYDSVKQVIQKNIETSYKIFANG